MSPKRKKEKELKQQEKKSKGDVCDYRKSKTYYLCRQLLSSLACFRHCQTTERVLPEAHCAYFEVNWSHSLSAFCFILLLKAAKCNTDPTHFKPKSIIP